MEEEIEEIDEDMPDEPKQEEKQENELFDDIVELLEKKPDMDFDEILLNIELVKIYIVKEMIKRDLDEEKKHSDK